MNKKLLSDLYLGKICPADSRGYKTEIYEAHTEKFSSLYDSIFALLSEENKKMLETMIEEYNTAQGEIIVNAFVKGFELGMSLTVEGLCSGNE